MADIFLSYSRKNSAEAEALMDALRAAGFAVWMDQTGISGAEKWSAEIVDALEAASAVVLLLSNDSNQSANVHREISLASEQGKHILPIDIEQVTLSRELKYPLAGLQRLPIDHKDSIVKSLKKLGVPTTGAAQQADVTESKKDKRKSLMVLPFEDLSPNEDNSWFSDGLTGELINALSNVKSLRLIDRKTSMEFKGFRGKTMDIARELEVRYFLEGQVRKFGDQIKISLELLDIEEGEHLWQGAHKGTFSDVFEIQETVAKKVVEGLDLTLTKDEKKKVLDRGTENADAYELFLKAREYAARSNKEGLLIAISLFENAIALDAKYADAYADQAKVLGNLFRDYDRNPDILAKAERLALQSTGLKKDNSNSIEALGQIYQLQGKFEEGERVLLQLTKQYPESSQAFFALGNFYMFGDNPAPAIGAFESSLELVPDNSMCYWNLVIVCDRSQDSERTKLWAAKGIPVLQKRLRLRPDDDTIRVQLLNFLFLTERFDESRSEVAILLAKPHLDTWALYNIGCTQCRLGDFHDALKTLTRCIREGYSRIEDFRADPDLDPLRGMPEFQALMAELEAKLAATKAPA